jgi:hypothetical protein
MIVIAVAALLSLQVQVQAGSSRDTAGRRSVSVGVRVGGAADSGRRIPVTAEHLATAFRTAHARTMLEGARAARFRQDSALRSYDAKVSQRMSVGMALRAAARDRLIARDEGVARVQWDRDHGAVVDLLGKRTTVPLDPGEQRIDENARTSTSLPIPYYPGQERLWIGGSVTRVEVDERGLVHPLAEGSEAYYRYESGDSIEFILPDDRRILLRELRVEARQPRWNLIVGSFWFDQATWQLVRSAYRLSVEMDIWEVAQEEARRDNDEDNVPGLVRGLINPMKASMQLFTVEYALFEGRFWLPVLQGGEGKIQVSLMRIPLTFEERYSYASVNQPVAVAQALAAAPPLPPDAGRDIRALRDSLRAAGVSAAAADSVERARYRPPEPVRRPIPNAALRDSLGLQGLNRRQIDSALEARSQALSDSAQAATARECAEKGSVMRRLRRFEDRLDVVLRTPCDLQSLRTSPELPASALDANEEVFGTRERDDLIRSLDFGLQAGWGPQRVRVDWGLPQTRYNRVEGLSTALGVEQELGLGYAWSAQVRGSQGDKQLTGELGVTRGNGRTTLGGAVYRRLASASDWGDPFTLGASLRGLFAARDEGLYYRTWGAELTRVSERTGRPAWRLFAEEHSNAPVTTRFSVFGGSHDDRFRPNVVADRQTFVGASVRWLHSWGQAPRGLRAITDLRLEGAGGTSEYGRGALDATVSRSIAGPVSAAVTLAGGSSLGTLPPQRNWFLGGVHTVRGQRAGEAAGDAFWLSRLELGLDRGGGAARAVVFGDLGWAGSRHSDWGKKERPLSGVGVGYSIFDGMLRFDVSRGIWPREQWRFDFSLEARY